MKFQEKINQVVALFDEKVLDAKTTIQSIQNLVSNYHFFEIEIEHRIGNFQFSVETAENGIIVTAYENGKRYFSRIFEATAHEVHIHNYCKKFATDKYYRRLRVNNHSSLS